MTRRALAEIAAAIVSLAIVTAFTVGLARTSSRVAAIEAATRALKASTAELRTAVRTIELPGGLMASVYVSPDGAESILHVYEPAQ